ncbi:hypothetical protein KC19_10G134300 [Ceratodon purpureus]|uniref:S1 motif domain-containing protein n=1 Tax=Ceratodon purpureus TaxID=3225 RepID=A0A8T0GLI4_CERPU|nr:hypothetical protein KC19_10G134300 [Ceratodon purpureus]
MQSSAMALPSCSVQCASARWLALRPSQVGASSKFGGRTLGLLAWRRRCHWGSQRTGIVKVMAMGRKKEAGKGGESERPDVKFDGNDLMELEFGRLLGEPRQATLAKVIGRKVNPEASYIDIEKKPIKKMQSSSPSKLSEAEFARLLNQEGRPNAQPPLSVYKPAKPASQSSENLPGLVKPPSRPGQPLPQAPRRTPSDNSSKPSSAAPAKKAVPLVTFGPGGFAAQSNKPSAKEDDYMNLVQKPAVPSPDSYKPSWPKIDSVPPMLIGKAKKVEEDYMSLVQKPAIPSPDSIKPSWPKNDAVPPMLIGQSKKAVESEDDSMLRKPRSGDQSVAPKPLGILDSEVGPRIAEDPKVPILTGKPSQSKPSKKLSDSPGPVLASPSSDISEEQFAKLLELAGSTREDQDVPSEIPTPTINLSKPKYTLGLKPTLIAKPPLDANKSEGVTSGDGSMSIPSDDLVLKASLSPAAANVETTTSEDNAEPTDSEAESGVDLSQLDEKPAAELAKPDNGQSDSEQAILRLVKKASRISPVRPPKRFSPAAPETLKSRIVDSVSSADDRLAGWSDEVKAAVKRSEAALPNIATQAPSEKEFDQLLQRRKAELIQRPVPPPTPEISPDPSEVSSQQRSAFRPASPSPKPPRDVAATTLSDKRIPSKEEEDQDWARAHALRESKTVEEVVFTRAIANGLLANFGSLVGFLPSYELSSRRRPPSFSAWAQDNGFVINRKLKSSASSESGEPANDSESPEDTEKTGGADAEYKRLLDLYGRARTDILLALVGETAKVVVVAVERERNQLRFSEKEAEGEGQELAQKKAQLMTSLNVGDIVKCKIKKVTNFGAFVELEGVPALIHISELSWNRVTDPSAILDVGQEVEVKVCRLDRYLQRISLSLKQMQPDPLRETLESLDLRGPEVSVGALSDDETTVMPELIGVTERLEAYKGIDSVQLGRRIQGNALAPTFQVYLSGQLDDGFKLLARSGNQVQEVLVQTALDRDSMKDAIRQCTFSDN